MLKGKRYMYRGLSDGPHPYVVPDRDEHVRAVSQCKVERAFIPRREQMGAKQFDIELCASERTSRRSRFNPLNGGFVRSHREQPACIGDLCFEDVQPAFISLLVPPPSSDRSLLKLNGLFRYLIRRDQTQPANRTVQSTTDTDIIQYICRRHFLLEVVHSFR